MGLLVQMSASWLQQLTCQSCSVHIVTDWMVKIRLADSAEQAVTVLRFSSKGTILLSGGEDTVALAWLLMDLLDASVPQNASQAPQPLHTW